MQISRKASALKKHLNTLRSEGKTIGFVPTMGALHEGHLAIVQQAGTETDVVVVSIFVNPTQFNNKADLAKYPRRPEQDIEKLRGTSCQLVFLPEEGEIYPGKVEPEPMNLGKLNSVMEGSFRPGHFDGVATVVGRLFEIVKPDKAFFGEKDFQQLAIIRHISKLNEWPVEIIAHPTERDPGGLALSSRNQLLAEQDKVKARAIWQNLTWARENFKTHTPAEIKEHIRVCLAKTDLHLEYVEIAESADLENINDWKEAKHPRVFIAAHISGVRLIDNLLLF